MSNHDRGLVNYFSGLSAEGSVISDYERRGYCLQATRWKGQQGEIDVIARDGDSYVFVEVKKSRDFARAAERVSPRQMRRLCNTAYEFLAANALGLATHMRFDVAMVNMHGEVQIIENAFGEL